ncbi:hypothetical protein VUR80DRAFT_7765 [Thermomyces stellatus]
MASQEPSDGFQPFQFLKEENVSPLGPFFFSPPRFPSTPLLFGTCQGWRRERQGGGKRHLCSRDLRLRRGFSSGTESGEGMLWTLVRLGNGVGSGSTSCEGGLRLAEQRCGAWRGRRSSRGRLDSQNLRHGCNRLSSEGTLISKPRSGNAVPGRYWTRGVLPRWVSSWGERRLEGEGRGIGRIGADHGVTARPPLRRGVVWNVHASFSARTVTARKVRRTQGSRSRKITWSRSASDVTSSAGGEVERAAREAGNGRAGGNAKAGIHRRTPPERPDGFSNCARREKEWKDGDKCAKSTVRAVTDTVLVRGSAVFSVGLGRWMPEPSQRTKWPHRAGAQIWR